MVTQYIERKLIEKSAKHQAKLKSLGKDVEAEPLSTQVILLDQTPQVRGMNTILLDRNTLPEDFIFYFDRISALLVEQYVYPRRLS
jgi:uridine kinase